MYGAPGPGYQGHNEAEKAGVENKQMGKEDTFLTTNPSHRASTANTARLIYPEYMCFFPSIFFRGAGACEVDCLEEVRENAKCQRNGWNWAARVAELRAEKTRTEESRVKRKTLADRDREKGEKEEETEATD